MEPDEWIRGEAAGPAGAEGDGGWPDDGWPHDRSPHDRWPDGGWPDGGWPAAARLAAAGKDRGHGGVPGFSVRTAVAVALLAAVAGVAAGLFLIRGIPAASVAGGRAPGAVTPSGLTPSGLAPSGNGQLRMVLTGRVLAVSRTSITIGGAGPSVTAAVTSATTVTGPARGIGGVKAGDEVSAQITGTASHLVATAIQDPAQ